MLHQLPGLSQLCHARFVFGAFFCNSLLEVSLRFSRTQTARGEASLDVRMNQTAQAIGKQYINLAGFNDCRHFAFAE